MGEVLQPIENIAKGLTFQNGFTGFRDAIETGDDIGLNYLIPGSSLLTDNLVSKGSQAQLNTPLGELAQLGSGAAGGGAFGQGLQSVGGAAEQAGLNNLISGVSNGFSGLSNGISNLYNGASDIGTAAQDGSSLAEFGNPSGYSTFLGGTAAPDTNLEANFTGFQNSPGSADFAGSAGTPGLGGAINASPVSSTVAAGGGGNLAGFGGTGSIGSDLSGGLSSTSVGQQGALGAVNNSDFPAFSSSAPVSNLDTGASSFTQNSGDVLNGGSNPLAGTGGTQQANGISGLFGQSGAPSGTFNYDISGNPVGASALGPSSPDYATASYDATGGNKMGALAGLFGNGATATGTTGGAGNNILNGLLRGGLGYLLNSKTSNDGIANATQAAQQQFAPYTQAGTNAENTLASLYGTNGTAAQQSAQQGFQNTPGYQFAENQGINAVNANAAAMGSPLSGNNQQAVNNYAQGTANQTYNNYVNQLQNLASGGLSAAGASGTAGLTGASAAAQNSQNNANAKNTAIGAGLSGLFPSGINLQQLLGGTNSQGLLSLFGS
jgi:hypothetical protein